MHGRTTFIIAHRVSTIPNFARHDRVQAVVTPQAAAVENELGRE